uniref:FAD-binding FR-type domain-containing protein n=1 Tax=Ananas comosus var. bracteatus TaxID=296719 RepID=A0A6V7Q4V5_ANACO|nr:unnamed protein product [Ananas comosus var. bracteatus]
MVVFEENFSHSILCSTPTTNPLPKSFKDSEIIEISIHPNTPAPRSESALNACFSSSSSLSETSHEDSPAIEIHVHFRDDPCHTCTSSSNNQSSPIIHSPPSFDKNLHSGTSPLFSQNNQKHPLPCCPPQTSAVVIGEEENGKIRLLSNRSTRVDFLDWDANGALKWKEAEENFDHSNISQCIEMKEINEISEDSLQDHHNYQYFNSNPYRASSPNSSPKIKIYLDDCGRNFGGSITEKEITQAILFSASTNQLTLTREVATECARLITDELDADQVAVELHSSKDEVVNTSTQTLPLHRFPPMPATDRDRLIIPSTVVFLRAHWRRIWTVLLWLAACAALFSWKFVQYHRRSAFEVMGYCLCTAKGAAETLKLNMALVLLPVCRNTVTWLRKSRRINSILPFNDTINFHKLIAAGIVIGVILHGSVHLTCDFPRIACADRPVFGRTIAEDFQYRRPSYADILATTEGVTGILMVVLMAAAFLLAARRLRRNSASLPRPIVRFAGFNAFWYSHHLFIAVYVLLIVHSMFLFLTDDFTEKTTWMYVSIPVVIYTAERVFRKIRSEIYDAKVLEVRESLSGKVLSLKMKKPAGFRYRSGTFMFLRCPWISKFEWHPFSLTSAPDDEHLSMHIRSLGDWSYQMYSIFQEALVSGTSDLPKICIDGPYGAASQDHSKYEILLLIGLGIGATPFIRILKDIANGRWWRGSDTEIPRKAYFYWVTREQGSFEWFRDIMKDVSALDEKHGVIEMYNYLTSVYQEGDKRSALISAIQALHFMRNGIDIISRTPVRTRFARPNWSRVFSGLACRHVGERIAVWREFVWGAIAGAFGEGMMHPIDTLKTRIQSQAVITGTQTQKNILQMVRTVWVADGLKVVWLINSCVPWIDQAKLIRVLPGITPGVTGSLATGATYFGIIESTKKWLEEVNPNLSGHWSHFIAGAVGDTLGSFVYVPCEVMKQRMQVQGTRNSWISAMTKGNISRSPGPDVWILYWNGSSRLFNFQGARSQRIICWVLVYTCQGRAFCWADVYSLDLQVTFYEALKDLTEFGKQKYLPNSDLHVSSTFEGLLLGGLAGGFSAYLTTPLDVIKTRLQVQGSTIRYKGFLDALRRIWVAEGLNGLFKGSVPRIIWYVPASALTFMAVEFLRDHFNEKLDEVQDVTSLSIDPSPKIQETT